MPVSATEFDLNALLDAAEPPSFYAQLPFKNMQVNHCGLAKKVTKQWGFELWLAHEKTPFAYKMIFIQAGKRTSLQYHEKKEEVNFVLSGQARLYYRHSSRDENITQDLVAGTTIHVKPYAIHRIEAISDVWLLEVSTPELDDVVRVEDDWSRQNGYIKEEHLSAS